MKKDVLGVPPFMETAKYHGNVYVLARMKSGGAMISADTRSGKEEDQAKTAIKCSPPLR